MAWIALGIFGSLIVWLVAKIRSIDWDMEPGADDWYWDD